MNHDTNPDPIRDLLDLASEGGSEELDPNDVAHLVGGAPDARTREALEARVAAASGEQRQLVAAVAEAGHERASRSRPWGVPLAVAAVVLCAVGAVWLFRGGSPTSADPLDDAALVAAFDAARARAPEALDGLAPYLAPERASIRRDVPRGGLRVIAPRGVVRSTPATIRWTSVAGGATYRIRVLSDEGTSVLESTTDAVELAWPAGTTLEPGSAYVVMVETTAAGVRVSGTAAFEAMSDTQATRAARALEALSAVGGARVRALLEVQMLMRFRLWEEAWQAAAAARDAGCEGAAFDETLRVLRGRSGRP